MTNVIECQLLEHQRRITHLQYKYAIICQDLVCITDKGPGIIEIVEHGNTTYYFGFFVSITGLHISTPTKEVLHHSSHFAALSNITVISRINTHLFHVVWHLT